MGVSSVSLIAVGSSTFLVAHHIPAIINEKVQYAGNGEKIVKNLILANELRLFLAKRSPLLNLIILTNTDN